MDHMDFIDVTVMLTISDEVSEASRFSIAAQLEQLLINALERDEISIPDGSIEDVEVVYDEDPYV